MNCERAIEICKQKLEVTMASIPQDMPEYCACSTGRYFELTTPLEFKNIETWMPSFFTGQAVLAYEQSKDAKYLDWLEGFSKIYEDKVYLYPENTMHDLGFLYTPYAIGLYWLTGKNTYRKMALKAADELSKRYQIKGKFIRAWGRVDEVDGPRASEAIIDCMMNIPLLFWAEKETGNPFYGEVAKQHADTTMSNFIRADGSVYHAFHFDRETGEPLWGCNYCGYADESFWARGCTWAIYGFMVAYSHTGKYKYLELSERLSKRFMVEIEMGGGEGGCIPYWDFRLPKTAEKKRDSSAAAIAASAFYSLASITKDNKYKSWADDILKELMTPEYLDTDISIPGILKHSNGLDHYTLFGDYFFMEALMKSQYDWQMFW